MILLKYLHLNKKDIFNAFLRSTTKYKLVVLILVFSFGIKINSVAQGRSYSMKKHKEKKTEKKFSKYSGGSVQHKGYGITKYNTIGFSINAMNYFGDIAPAPSKLSTDYTFTKAGFGLTFGRVVDPNATIRAALNFGTLTGEDFKTADPEDNAHLGRYTRNAHFRNTIIEFSLGAEFNLIPNSGGAKSRFPLNPYIFLGIAVFKHNPQALAPDVDLQGNPLAEAGQWVDLQPLGTEGQNIEGSENKPYELIQFAIPIGLGVKLRLPGNFDANIEIGFRQTLTDYLDDVSTTYPDLGALDSELARAISDRGTESKSLISGSDRDPNLITIAKFTSPANGEIYNTGANYGLNGVRGGSKDKDIYVITQLRLVYLLDHKRSKKGKFR
jgi:hypothetical protein